VDSFWTHQTELNKCHPVGQTAKGNTEKARTLVEISFPPPAAYEGQEGTPGGEGRAQKLVVKEPDLV
jgi:hypothetical protein